MVSIPEHLAEEYAKQMEEIKCAQLKEKNTPSREILDLLDEVKERFHSKPKSTDMKILAAIAKAEEGDEIDYYKLDDALQMINVRFNISEEETNDELDGIAQAFGDRLVVENMAQLVSKYNSVMDNVRHYFPDFEFTQPSNNYVYGKNINVSCLLRWCSDKDIVQEYRNNIISKEFDDLYSPNNMEKIMADMKLYYSEKYKGDMKQLAELHKGSAYSLIPPELKNLLGYAVYQGEPFEEIQDFMRSDKLLKPADTVRVLQTFFSSAVLPFYSPTDVTIYRGDRLMHSSQQVNVKGFLSGTLHISKLENFLKKSGRIIQINIPAGTPIIPIFLENDKELEVCLLPGTELTRNFLYDHSDQSHFAEYDVTGNPPKFTPREEATIIKFAIPGVIRVTADEKASHPIHRPKRSKVMEFVEKLPFGHYLDLEEFRYPEEQYDDDGEPFDVDLSDLDERAEFYMNLVNKYYQGEY